MQNLFEPCAAHGDGQLDHSASVAALEKLLNHENAYHLDEIILDLDNIGPGCQSRRCW
jgi:hypothetical protein